MPYTPTGGYYPALPRKVLRRVPGGRVVTRTGKAVYGQARPARLSRSFNENGRPARRMGQWAVLICFDSAISSERSKMAALKCVAKISNAIRAISANPTSFASMDKMKALSDLGIVVDKMTYPCCVALHDCQKHPLNPRS